MKELHPKIEETLKFPDHGTVIDGAFCSEAIDTSGEMIDIKEMDISSLNDGTGVANTEHINPDDKQFKEAKAEEAGQWAVIVGRVIFAKKIFDEDDCTSERELACWKEVGLPFIYGAVELFDSEGHFNAQELAATIWHYHKRKMPVVARYSIEGATLDRDGHILRPTIARRVAITIKPCNQAAYSSLVEKTSVPNKKHKKEEELSKKEGIIGTFETESFPLIIQDLRKNTFEALEELSKAFELGSSNVAPSQLTGAAATTPEHHAEQGEKKKMKSRLLAAMRDWNKTTPIKEHLTHHLKDVHESFIDKFSKIAEDIVLGKRELVLNKKEVEYKGNMVSPGQAQILAGPFAGSVLPIFHLDDKHAHVQSFKAGGQASHIVNKLPIHSLGSHWAILSKPSVSLVPNIPEEIKELNRSPAQSLILYKLDLSRPIQGTAKTNTHGEEGAGWYINGLGKTVYIKPEIDSNYDEYKAISTAEREALFYVAASEFFNLDRYVPTTAVIFDSKTERKMSVMEKFDGFHFYVKKPNQAGVKAIKTLGNSGVLEKLAIMDISLGNCDRNKLNYMLNESGEIGLIDNSFLFNFKDEIIPAYILDYSIIKGQNLKNILIQQSTIDWICGLDVFAFKDFLESLGVDEVTAGECTKRLLSIQTAVLTSHFDLGSIIFSHFNFLNPVVPNAEENI